MIDYRSDTVTKPGEEMRKAMLNAPVGDDVFGEDATVNELESYISAMFGMEAALYCPSGTMTNQIAIKVHTRPGDEVICDADSHVYVFEGGGIGFNSGCQARTINGERGRISADQIGDVINPDDVHRGRSRLVCLENTSNMGGGSCYDFEQITYIRSLCDHHLLKMHLDGARLFNALVEKNESPASYGNIFDSISICLSKGLGAPVGSLLLGSKEFIKEARRIRKVFGGGMRQAGIIAAGGLYALQNNIERLKEDHHHAKKIAEVLLQKPFTGKMLPVETNIIIFEVVENYTASSLAAKLKEKGILVIPISKSQVRMVFHLDISPDMVSQTIEILHQL